MSDARDRNRPFLDRLERFVDAVIPPPERAVERLELALRLRSAGDRSGALVMVAQALELAPEHAPAVYLKAELLAESGALADALAWLDYARERRALPAAVLALMVHLAARLGDTPRALAFHAEARARVKAPDALAAHRLLAGARALLARGDSAAGLLLARAATQLDPALGAAWLPLAHEALSRGDHEQARRALDRAMPTLDPADARSQRDAGVIALALGDREKARVALRRAWILGDGDALAPLLGTMDPARDGPSLERLLSEADSALAAVARSVIELARDPDGAREALRSVHADDVPAALWSYALETARRSAPDVAMRWARESPARPGSATIQALHDAHERRAAGEHARARARLVDAMDNAVDGALTRAEALALYCDSARTDWSRSLAAMLDELSVIAEVEPRLETDRTVWRARRRELDETLRVALLGEFSAGKSTLLNAWVGAEISPMGVLPTTAYVLWLRHGEARARIVDVHGGALLATVDEAPRVVARMREHGEEVRYVEITLPLPLLSRIELVDTPGFNAGHADHGRHIEHALELADVALWVFDARQAGRASEREPLERARARGLPVAGVLNRIDRVTADERNVLLARVQGEYGALVSSVLPVSAREALALAGTRDPAGLAATGMPALLEHVEGTFVAHRERWKNYRVATRVRPTVVAAQRVSAARVDEARARRETRHELLATLANLREALPLAAEEARASVARVLGQQLAALRVRGTNSREADTSALALDAAVESTHRARTAALHQLRPLLDRVCDLAVRAGLVPSASTGLLIAPIELYLDRAASLAAQGTTLAGSQGSALPACDPVVAIEQAIPSSDTDAPVGTTLALAAALEIALECLATHTRPPAKPGRQRSTRV